MVNDTKRFVDHSVITNLYYGLYDNLDCEQSSSFFYRSVSENPIEEFHNWSSLFRSRPKPKSYRKFPNMMNRVRLSPGKKDNFSLVVKL